MPEEQPIGQVTQDNALSNQGSSSKTFKYFLWGVGGAIIGVAVIFWGVTITAAYNQSENPVVLRVADWLQLSVAEINKQKITYADYITDKKALRIFISKQPEQAGPMLEEDISKQALSRLIGNKLLMEVAQELAVTVSDEEVAEAKPRLLGAIGSDTQIEQQIRDIFGWSVEQYIQRVVKPFILEQKVAQGFAESTGEFGQEFEGAEESLRARHILFKVDDSKADKEIEKQAQKVLERVKKGEDFAALAQEFGSDGTKDQGGDLGWFGRGVMVKDFDDAVFALEPNQVGDELVKSQFGYHIVKLEEKRKLRDFEAFFENYLRTAKIEMKMKKVANPFEV